MLGALENPVHFDNSIKYAPAYDEVANLYMQVEL